MNSWGKFLKIKTHNKITILNVVGNPIPKARPILAFSMYLLSFQMIKKKLTVFIVLFYFDLNPY